MTLPDDFFRKLTRDEETEFREWARANYDPDVTPMPVWHPVVRDEWERLRLASLA
jgi:hypothetical protein